MNIEMNTRVSQALTYLMREGVVKTQADFCQAIGYHRVSFNKVLSNERPFPKKKVQDLTKVFGISGKYILEGVGAMLDKPDPIVKKIKASDVSVQTNDGKTEIRFIDEWGRENILEFEKL